MLANESNVRNGAAGHQHADRNGAGVFDVEKALIDYYLGIRPPGAVSSDYLDWRRANLSGYSYTNSHEMVAEAFADVFINDDDAHDTSKVIYLVLADAVHGKKYVKPDDWGFTAASKPRR